MMETTKSNLEKYKAFREKYPTFVYEGYQAKIADGYLEIVYHFDIPGLFDFRPTWRVPVPTEVTDISVSLENMIFSLGMVELVSYWKIACPPKVIVKPKGLTLEQIAWWKKLYFQGLGEFYYTNGIEENPEDFMTIEADGPVYMPEGVALDENDIGVIKATIAADTNVDADRGNESGILCRIREHTDEAHPTFLIPVGGGKDSNVTMDILKKYRGSSYCYIINMRGATEASAKVAGFTDDRILEAKRTLDANMLYLNKQGYLNGHTPFSAIVAFSATMVAYLWNLRYIPLSNESSANETTVEGSYVNHQYSKCFDFEWDFHSYEAKYIASGSYYFSLLRPLSEFQIAGYFASIPQYHPVFKSCNAGSKQNIWCGGCSKCLFVWLILSPFLPQETLTGLFGRDMAADPAMEFYFRQLIGEEKEKPFECVGSRDEVCAAIALTIRDYPAEKELPYLFAQFVDLSLQERYEGGCEVFYRYYDKKHLLPAFLEREFEKALKERGLYRES